MDAVGVMPAVASLVDGDETMAALLSRCAGRDRRALRQLYDAMSPVMLGVAMRMLRSRSLAEEAVQDAFVQVWDRAGQFDPSLGSPRAWLLGILRYRALDRLDAEARHRRLDGVELDEAAQGGLLPPVAPDVSEDSVGVRRCLGELADGPQRSILLAYVEGCSHGEIAERLGEPLGTVKSWILRGLQSLKRCLER